MITRLRFFSAAMILCMVTSAYADAVVEIPFERLRSGQNSQMRAPAFFVARSEAELQQIWRLHTVSPVLTVPAPLPQVDFAHHVVIAFFGGGGSACEPYEVTRVVEYPDRITVQIAHPKQGKNCTCIDVLATPYELVTIGRTAKPIDYKIQVNPADCFG